MPPLLLQRRPGHKTKVTAMKKARDARGVPTGDGAGGQAPHTKTELMPTLPDRHGYEAVRLPGGEKAVITRVPRNRGSADRPEYRDTFYLHTSEGTTPYALEDIRRIQATLEPWTPRLKTDDERKALQEAEEGEILWAEALSVIGVDGSKDRQLAEVSKR